MRKLILGLFLMIAPVFAALPVDGTTVWEVRPSTGDNTNGGCFVTGSSGTDFSQQGAAQKSFTDLTIGGTTTEVTSVLNPFAATDVGNCIHLISGSGCTAEWFYIVSVATVTATLDRSAGTAASVCVGNEGGALQTLVQLNTNGVQSQLAWMKAEATVMVGSQITLNYTSAGNSNRSTQISGYTTTRGDGGQVTLQATAGITVINIQNNLGGVTLRNFILDCNGVSGSQGINIQGTSGPNTAENLTVIDCLNRGVLFNNNNHSCIRCTVTGVTNTGSEAFRMEQGNGPNWCYYCTAVDNTAIGFNGPNGGGLLCFYCLAIRNTGGNSDGFFADTNNPQSTRIVNSIAFGNGRDGIRLTSVTPPFITNNISYGNGGFGVNDTMAALPAGGAYMNHNAFGNNTGGDRNNVSAGPGDVALSADPFTDSAMNDFSLNNTSGGGADLKGVGFPGTFGAGTGFLDIGTLQSAGGASATASGSPIIQ